MYQLEPRLAEAPLPTMRKYSTNVLVNYECQVSYFLFLDLRKLAIFNKGNLP